MTKQDYAELADLLYPNVHDIEYYFNKYPSRQTSGEVTRLAPSPTGYLHIGQVYQSIIHRLFANKTNGIFYLRLEDTDAKREVAQAGEIAYDMLQKLNLTPDEGYRGRHEETGDYGPYVQSNRLKIYHAFAHELVKRGRAFPCFCSITNGKEEILKRREEELEENSDLEVKDVCRNLTLDQIKANLLHGKPFALRLLSVGDPNKTHLVKDAIKGEKEVRENSKDDILIKSNGVPVYGFAHVVDDTLMGTTTIVRGQEWYQSLPVHLELSEAFGFKPFKYAHTPNICVLDEQGNKRKISKRKDVFADTRYFLTCGYPIEALIEYLLNLLNSDFELWRKNNPSLPYTEFAFDIRKIGVTNPLFDFAKLDDISKGVISRYTAEELYNKLLIWAKEWDAQNLQLIEQNKDNLTKVFSIGRGGDRPRKDIAKLNEVLDLYDYVLPGFKQKCDINLDGIDVKNMIEFLSDYANQYEEAVDNQAWFDNLKQVSLAHNYVDNKTYKQNPSNYAGSINETSKFVRIAITNKENSPELYSIMKIIGKQQTIERIKGLINLLQQA